MIRYNNQKPETTSSFFIPFDVCHIKISKPFNVRKTSILLNIHTVPDTMSHHQSLHHLPQVFESDMFE